jgi:hypothetical protein
MRHDLSPARMDARRKALVHSPGLMNRRLLCCSLLAVLGLVPMHSGAEDVPAEHRERAVLLRELLEQGSLPPASDGEPASLPGAKLDAQVRQEREQLDLQRSADQAWRRMLGEQQAGRLRQEMTGIPSAQAPARALGFERDQRMRELSARILQQDQQFRQNLR